MYRELIITADGSTTVSIPSQEVTYRSRHGALQESRHVFIEAGLLFAWSNQAHHLPLNVFEVGFGTGLNALLTAREALAAGRVVNYTTIEPYPLEPGIVGALNYDDADGQFPLLHKCRFDELTPVNPYFNFIKLQVTLAAFEPTGKFDLVYFDAFGPVTHPAMWSEQIFSKLFSCMNSGAVLTTYCSKSVVRHTMKAAGFVVSKIQGPRGKREMVRAIRP